jgi:hypothetical protein
VPVSAECAFDEVDAVAPGEWLRRQPAACSAFEFQELWSRYASVPPGAQTTDAGRAPNKREKVRSQTFRTARSMAQ